MKKLLQKFGIWMWSNRKVLMTVLIVVLVMNPHAVFAATPTTAGDNSEMMKNLAQLVNVLVRFLNTLLWPLLLVIGDLMDTDMIIGPGMEERLLAIWVEVRNLVNIAIALALIVIAFYNVLGLGGGEGELAIKTALPKVVLGLILVNFTYVGGKVMLDVANVGTNIAFALPQVMIENDGTQFDVDNQIEEFEKTICFPSPVTVDGVESQSHYTGDEDGAPVQTKLFCQLNETDEFIDDSYTTAGAGPNEYAGLRPSFKSLYFSNLNKNNLAIVMATNMGSLGGLELLKQGAINNFSDLTVNTIFALVMYTIYAISYIVLAVVLVVRVIVLWLALALSPVAVLFYVIPQTKEWIGGGGGDFTQKVIKHLVAPIIIGVSMSMGFLLMNAWSVVGKQSFSAYGDTAVGDVISTEFLISGIDDLPKLIIAVASVAVVWIGVFTAANDTYAAGIAGFIKEKGESLGGMLMKAPLRVESIPFATKDGEKNVAPLSILGLMDDKMREYQYGHSGKLASDRKELEGILKENGWGGLVPEGASSDALSSSTRLFQNAQLAENGAITASQAKEMARDLISIVGQSDALKKSGHQDEYIKQLTTIQETLGSQNTREAEKAFRDLQEMAKEKLTADDVGIEAMNLSGSQYGKFIDAMEKGAQIKFTPDKPENPRAEAKPTPAAVPSIVTQASTASTGFASAVSAIQADPQSNSFASRATKTQEEVKKANDAVAALTTDYTEEKKGEALVLAEKAKKSAETLLADMKKGNPTLDKKVSDPMTQSISDLEKVQTKLATLK